MRDEYRQFDGTGQTVAVIDTGWGAGFGADAVIHQWDFADQDGDAASPVRYSHGGLVAGVLLDTAPDVDIIHLKVFGDAGGSAAPAVLAMAIDWVLDHADAHGITAVNLSLGGGREHGQTVTSLSDGFEALADQGVAVFAATGNLGGVGISQMATSPGVIPVGAVDAKGTLAAFSQHHPDLVDLYALGVSVGVTDLDGDIHVARGTSLAVPHAVGAYVSVREASETLTGEPITPEQFLDLAVSAGEAVGGAAGGVVVDADRLVAAYVDSLAPADGPDPAGAGDAAEAPAPDEPAPAAEPAPAVDTPPEVFDRQIGAGGGARGDRGWLDETLTGGAGSDRFGINYGDDVLTGGGGSDVFAFNSASGDDRITDFDPGQDFLDLGYWAAWADLRAVDGDTVISIYDDRATVTLVGVAEEDWALIRDAQAGAVLG